jgi:hypothetical protein
MTRPRRTARRDARSLQPVLEESPALRSHSLARARSARRVFGGVFMVALVLVVAWIVWYAWSLRAASSSAQAPMRKDHAAIDRLTKENTDLTLLVIRPGGESSAAVVAVMRQPAKGSGTWIEVLPAAPVPTSDVQNDTPATLLARGRASLIKAVESLAEARFRHYVEVNSLALATAVDRMSSQDASRSGVTKRAPTTVSTSSTVAGVVDTAMRYDRVRAASGPLGALRVPTFARALAGSSVSDLSAGELDALLRRLGVDAREGHVRIAVVPTRSVNGKTIVSASGAVELMTRMLSGLPFGSAGQAVARVAPGSVTVSVLNGAGREGVAAQAARILKRAGYRVTSSGNANQFVYDKTLVVYDSKRSNAEAVARDLRLGRIVASRGMYALTTDVLVIVGGDWPHAP